MYYYSWRVGIIGDKTSGDIDQHSAAKVRHLTDMVTGNLAG